MKKVFHDGQYIVRQVLQETEKKKKINNKNQEFKIDNNVIESAMLLKKYSKYFKDYPADPEFILISKRLPLSELKMIELIHLLSVMYAVKE